VRFFDRKVGLFISSSHQLQQRSARLWLFWQQLVVAPATMYSTCRRNLYRLLLLPMLELVLHTSNRCPGACRASTPCMGRMPCSLLAPTTEPLQSSSTWVARLLAPLEQQQQPLLHLQPRPQAQQQQRVARHLLARQL
jgi:hypothetical protein